MARGTLRTLFLLSLSFLPGSRLLADEVQDLVWTAVDGSTEAARAARERLAELAVGPQAVKDILERGRSGLPAAAPGSIDLEVLRSDGGSDPLYVHVPEGYDPSRPVGLVLGLHGMGGNGKDIRRALKDEASRRGVLLACPYAGKGRVIPKNWKAGEDEVALRALRFLFARYAIDPDRVWLVGVSLGGFGTWEIGLTHPDRFAALVTVAGGLSFVEYAGITDSWTRDLLVNAWSLPVLMAHGGADDIVPVRFDRRTKEDLEELGYAVRYMEDPELGHFPPDAERLGRLLADLFDWLANARRDPWPCEVVRRVHRRDRGSDRWVRLDRAGWTGTLRARAVTRSRIEVEGEDVERATLLLSSSLVDFREPLAVVSGDRVVFEGRLEPSVDTILDAARRRGETRFLPECEVPLDLSR